MPNSNFHPIRQNSLTQGIVDRASIGDYRSVSHQGKHDQTLGQSILFVGEERTYAVALLFVRLFQILPFAQYGLSGAMLQQLLGSKLKVVKQC